jgi:arylsulfatase
LFLAKIYFLIEYRISYSLYFYANPFIIMNRPKPPNIVFILVDQMRGDCLSALGHPVVKTPNLDEMIKKGMAFTSAYSTCPSCIAARASIFTGMYPTTHGRLGYRDRIPWRYENTMAQVLTDAGYQTHCVGKTHFYPQRLPLGFESQDSYEATLNFGDGYVNDYAQWLAERTNVQETDAGLGFNSWVGGRSVLPEELHNSSWVTTKGIDFLKRRDSSRPFFINLSFHRPHAPLDPPKEYLDLYRDSTIPPVPVGDWAARHDAPVLDESAWQGRLTQEELSESHRSYYALITHIDAQIGRFRKEIELMNIGPTWFIFTSDHGEMLGDHHLFRKTYAYEGSARIPMIVVPPLDGKSGISKEPVSLEDIMPTLLDVAGVEIPNSVEGKSLLPLLSESPEEIPWRDVLHGEHSACYSDSMAMQYLTDGKTKYIWYTTTGEEQLFDLDKDPGECDNLVGNKDHDEQLKQWRSRMIKELSKRPADGMTDGTSLIPGVKLPPFRPELITRTIH